MLYISIFCIFCRFFCLLTIKIFFPKKKNNKVFVNRMKQMNVSLALRRAAVLVAVWRLAIQDNKLNKCFIQ